MPVSPVFPEPPPGAVQSYEPADVESSFRRGYFTNLDRDEVLRHYKSQFKKGSIFMLNLNYPPENSYELIRDQTRSTYLEELVHPLRDSIFINGYIPEASSDHIAYKGIPYSQKITIKYNTSSLFSRVMLSFFIVIVIYFLVKEYLYEIKHFKKIWT